MTTIPCNFTTTEDLRPHLSLPQDKLRVLAGECNEVCLLIYGNGNPDLAGVGVLVSHALALVLAVLFGPFIFLDCCVLRAYRSAHTPLSFTTWLLEHQSDSLWSQLYFALTMSLAGCIRQFQIPFSVYEMAAINNVVTVASISLSLVLTAVYQGIESIGIFIFMIVAIVVLSVLAVVPLSTLWKYNGLILACLDVSKEQRLPWSEDTLSPYDKRQQFPELFSNIVLVLLPVGIWCYLRLRRRHWMGDEGHGRMKWKYRLLIGLSFLVYIPILRIAGKAFYLILLRRNALRVAWNGETGEDVWEIGQIGAMLTWAPLLVKMGSSAFEVVVRRGRHDESAPRRRTPTWSLEGGQLPGRRHTK